MRNFILIALAALFLVACAPEVGTEKWCDKMDDTPSGDWSVNEARDYAKHCVMGNYVDKDD
jgi:hypothetical protein